MIKILLFDWAGSAKSNLNKLNLQHKQEIEFDYIDNMYHFVTKLLNNNLSVFIEKQAFKESEYTYDYILFVDRKGSRFRQR